VREREKERKKGGDRERKMERETERERGKEREREREKEGERDRDVEYGYRIYFSLTKHTFLNCPELLFLKGMTGALAPFSNLVDNICNVHKR
jgi:hypothetical protein